MRSALSICIAAMLAGCGGSQPAISTPGLTQSGTLQSYAHPQTSGHKHRFIYTGKEAKFVVRSGVTALTIVADGAQGGGDTQGNYSEAPGLGGEMSAAVPVRPGEKLYVFVGGEGGDQHRGYNGGGEGGSSDYDHGYYGGGASDVREGSDALRDRILVAGGGGGAGGGYYDSCPGGAGGGVTGGRGACHYSSSERGIGGAGGTQSNGGSGGAGGGHAGQPGTDGALGSGGDGGASGSVGHGYYGGGGGGGGEAYGSCSCRGGYGGGGGSSYIESNAHKVSNTQGVRSRNGLVVISW